jgi:hypothetical protein
MRAQALTNLDAFGHPDPQNPPIVPGYTFGLDLVRNNPIYNKPRRFNQTETAFLEAKVKELLESRKLEKSEAILGLSWYHTMSELQIS